MEDTRMQKMRTMQPYAPGLMARGTDDPDDDERAGLDEDDDAILEACSQLQNDAYAEASGMQEMQDAAPKKRGRRRNPARKKDPAKPAARRGRRKASYSVQAAEDGSMVQGETQTAEQWRTGTSIADCSEQMTPEERKAFDEQQEREFDEALREKRVPMMKYLKPGTDIRKVTLAEAKQIMRARLGLADNGVAELNQAPIAHFCSDDGVPCWRHPEIEDDALPGPGTTGAVAGHESTAGSRDNEAGMAMPEKTQQKPEEAGCEKEDTGRYEKEPEKAEEEAEECCSREAVRGARQDDGEDKEHVAKAKKLFFLIPAVFILAILGALAVWFSWSGVYGDSFENSSLHGDAGPEAAASAGIAAWDGMDMQQGSKGQSPEGVAQDKTLYESHNRQEMPAWPDMPERSHAADGMEQAGGGSVHAGMDAQDAGAGNASVFSEEPWQHNEPLQHDEALQHKGGIEPQPGQGPGEEESMKMEERLRSFEESLQKTEEGMRMLQQMLMSAVQKDTGQKEDAGGIQERQEDRKAVSLAAQKNAPKDKQQKAQDRKKEDRKDMQKNEVQNKDAPKKDVPNKDVPKKDARKNDSRKNEAGASPDNPALNGWSIKGLSESRAILQDSRGRTWNMGAGEQTGSFMVHRIDAAKGLVYTSRGILSLKAGK